MLVSLGKDLNQVQNLPVSLVFADLPIALMLALAIGDWVFWSTTFLFMAIGTRSGMGTNAIVPKLLLLGIDSFAA